MRSSTNRPQRDWLLFADWSRSHGKDPNQADLVDLARFFVEVPVTASTRRRRVLAVLRARLSTGQPLNDPDAKTPTYKRAYRKGDKHADPDRALTQLVPYEHPASAGSAFRARRDGFIIVLIGVLGLTRAQALKSTVAAIDLEPILKVHGVPIAMQDPPQACHRCAVTRWLRVAAFTADGSRSGAWFAIDPSRMHPGQHDCEEPLVEGMVSRIPVLVPAISAKGLFEPQPLTRRAVTGILAKRQILTAGYEPKALVERRQVDAKVAREEMETSSNKLVDADSEIDAMFNRIEELIAMAEADRDLMNTHS